ncbi:MAG: Toxin-antitoxin system, antitoxin component, Xre family [Candidatus Levybacteria bacterium GW2011_GWA2_37_36]|uniref:Toxin-antitoxin system, antitoxin component, Xre family n=1 Tax=Candidatus Roizmanbacteria bacterium GW2011_GWC2_34_23 TaxID=1618484 RepID=A0A0G0E2Y7_9BACT|nr:MAG: Toxin-antitoxin system, antitoxin component, Xre family [Candidatus Roizmanbacteria bacterium GW2011_GWC2_34_23]KKQ33830.1 MAG: Toxin-antitoxin system, antitoxin component, Xre family [Candidatus Levybacteria bacterium GW2011_GWA2_37_36]
MKNKLVYTFQDHLKHSLKDPQFEMTWKKSQVEYDLASALIKKRLSKNFSQRILAKKVNTTQAVISRIETMSANPSLLLLKRLAEALDSKLILQFK